MFPALDILAVEWQQLRDGPRSTPSRRRRIRCRVIA
jgi:hypothetical protein